MLQDARRPSTRSWQHVSTPCMGLSSWQPARCSVTNPQPRQYICHMSTVVIDHTNHGLHRSRTEKTKPSITCGSHLYEAFHYPEGDEEAGGH
ncbi:hypothetical protein Hamer_G014473 [Homarus americanus]|uniref:Uncharacterized protein n=1 Tax=Homarus americanus TaxID=6706 RepID=A0A8J5JX92_HOMAM|nr:hypothetical protein Hamer_G014473 [Homarus americanus]